MISIATKKIAPPSKNLIGLINEVYEIVAEAKSLTTIFLDTDMHALGIPVVYDGISALNKVLSLAEAKCQEYTEFCEKACGHTDEK